MWSASLNEAADVQQDRQSQHGKGERREYLAQLALEQLHLKALYELLSAVVQRQFRNHQVHQQVDDVGNAYDQDYVQLGSPGGNVGDCEYSASHSVAYDYARGLEQR